MDHMTGTERQIDGGRLSVKWSTSGTPLGTNISVSEYQRARGTENTKPELHDKQSSGALVEHCTSQGSHFLAMRFFGTNWNHWQSNLAANHQEDFVEVGNATSLDRLDGLNPGDSAIGSSDICTL